MQHRSAIANASSTPLPRRTRKLFSLLAAQERRVIMILRLSLSPAQALKDADRSFYAALPERTRDAFAALAEAARANDLAIFAAYSTFVSEDELAILSRIILFQRPTQSGQWRIANPFQQALKRCAEALEQEGRRLLPRVALCDAYMEREGCFRIDLIVPDPLPLAPEAEGERSDGPAEPRAGTLKARALAMVRNQEIVRTSQFNAAGISNQYLSLLCKGGYVEKSGHGFYRLPNHFRRGK